MKIINFVEKFLLLTVISTVLFAVGLNYLLGINLNNYSQYQFEINATMYGMLSAIIVIYMMDHKS